MASQQKKVKEEEQPPNDEANFTPQATLLLAKLSNTTVDGYKLGRCLGAGANGIVFEATKENADEAAVMKIALTAHGTAELEFEGLIMEKIADTANMEGRTSHLVRKMGAGHVKTQDETGKNVKLAYVVMEMLEGNPVPVLGNLEGEDLELKVIEWGLQLLKAIFDIHQTGFLHRDVKPENVGLYKKDLLVLYDVGMARAYLDGRGKHREMRVQVGTRGTDEWCSLGCDQGRDQGRVDDLWGWLYMMVEWMNCRSSCPLAWAVHPGHANIRQFMKTDLFPARVVLNSCSNAFYRIQLYLRTLCVTDTPDYFFLASLLHEAKAKGKNKPKAGKVKNAGVASELEFLDRQFW